MSLRYLLFIFEGVFLVGVLVLLYIEGSFYFVNIYCSLMVVSSFFIFVYFLRDKAFFYYVLIGSCRFLGFFFRFV